MRDGQQTGGGWEKAIARFFLFIGSIVLTLVLMELGLRYFRPVTYLRPPVRPHWIKFLHQPSSIPGLAYEMAPNMERIWEGVTIKSNGYGMRDDDSIPSKTDSLRRIVVLGDSYTFGLGVPAEETYPKVLERRLNESTSNGNYHYNVLNFGVIGYSTRDEALLLKHRALAWHPDVVIIGYVLNDPEIDPIQPLPAGFETRWWQHFHLLRLIARVKNNWDIDRLGGGDYYRFLHAEGGDKWPSVVSAFSNIKDMASQRGFKVLVVIFPMVHGNLWSGGWIDYPYKGIHKQVSDLAAKNGFQVVDLCDVYSHYPPRDLVLSPTDDHPTRMGHDLAARAIEEKLMAEHSFFFNTKKQERKR